MMQEVNIIFTLEKLLLNEIMFTLVVWNLIYQHVSKDTSSLDYVIKYCY